MSDIGKKLVKIMNDFLENHEENPTRIYIPKFIENEMTAAGTVFHLRLRDLSMEARDAFGEPAMFGCCCLLIWDAKEYRADLEKEDFPIIKAALMRKHLGKSR